MYVKSYLLLWPLFKPVGQVRSIHAKCKFSGQGHLKIEIFTWGIWYEHLHGNSPVFFFFFSYKGKQSDFFLLGL